MLRTLKDLEQYTVSATDGEIGTVAGFLLDDERWAVRYLVVETGGFFRRRQVLISPISFGETVWPSRRFQLTLTMKNVEDSPSVELDEPVSRQHERRYYGYYGYPYYWGGVGLWGLGAYPGLLAGADPAEPAEDDDGDAHLRKASELRGYHVQGVDATIGHVEDFIVDPETWAVRYLVIDTRNWWFGKKVLVAPNWASRVSWSERTVHVEMSRTAIKSGPEWKASAAIDREYEARLYDYYGRPIYWGSDDQLVELPAMPPAPEYDATERPL